MTPTCARIRLVVALAAGPILLAAAGGIAHAASKGQPAGIFCLTRGDIVEHPNRQLARMPCWTNPNVDGVTLRTRWNKIEPAPGRADWTFFDAGLTLAHKHHKRVALSVTAGQFAPAWVYAGGAEAFQFARNKGQPATMPLPWDKAFRKQWRGFVRSLGKRYDGAPEVAYVMIGGPGRSIESYFVKSAADIKRLNALGGMPKWLEGSRAIVDMYAAAFPHTPFLLAMGPPTPTADGHAALKALVDYGAAKYPGRFGVMNDALAANTGGQRHAKYGPQTVKALSPTTTTGFQMVLPTRKLKGTLQEALARAIQFKAHVVELYHDDCDDPRQAAVLRDARKFLKPAP